ncbi:hypothetical protein SAMN05660479_02275 [Microbulbifer thermotolerans]|nr:hypothetical protein SAMN05660479_02275 [Microbulbifer thermotolerans]
MILWESRLFGDSQPSVSAIGYVPVPRCFNSPIPSHKLSIRDYRSLKLHMKLVSGSLKGRCGSAGTGLQAANGLAQLHQVFIH